MSLTKCRHCEDQHPCHNVSAPISAAAWRKLYDDLGLDIQSQVAGASDCEASEEYTTRLLVQVKTLREVRSSMRALDPALPAEEVDTP